MCLYCIASKMLDTMTWKANGIISSYKDSIVKSWCLAGF